ncbi:DUF4037 domain-containing protein [Streptosporangium saharense]|uniref:DUF4037 domain-containing protein n=1 Tax=Streptosporangium saharense TaxID=1706840 RepID=A0A7W7QL67_9ACTN|nr:DUF4037 domain-containing protein [Streptosporangium saharense]MBB4915131.1 hypothetical protein [Streptosporangium saharense]
MNEVMSSFVPGLQLSRDFYVQAVRPAIAGVTHSAALIGPGSEVLAFDTERSAARGWGPRVVVFVAEEAVDEVTASLTGALPGVFGGYPVVVGGGIQVAGASAWLSGRLGFDPLAGAGVLDWLSVPWQRLAEVTRGEVFHDGLGVLERVRSVLRWYPMDLGRYVVACQWRRVARLASFPRRCGETGDDLGSAVFTAELVGELMRLVLLTRRRYPPYAKWVGGAFARLSGTAELGEMLSLAVGASDWRSRERLLGLAGERVAALHDRTRPVPGGGGWGFVDGIVEELVAGVADPVVRGFPLTGSVDQFGGCSELLEDPARCRAAVRAVFGL